MYVYLLTEDIDLGFQVIEVYSSRVAAQDELNKLVEEYDLKPQSKFHKHPFDIVEFEVKQ